MSKAGKILDAFLADEFHGMNGMAEGDVERSQILHLIEYVLKRNVTDSKTIDERVNTFKATMQVWSVGADWERASIDEFRRHLIAHEEQVREECIDLIPTTWLDPLLTGENAVTGDKLTRMSIEKLLNALRDRIRAKGGDDHGEL